jgi:RimJ/RimL family protein N-acetyltransferase
VSGVEMGWALARHAWGQGYVSEAARAVAEEGLGRWELPEILAFTADTNLRSQAVMARAGFTRDPSRDFDHPLLPADHPLNRHLVYFVRPAASL